MGRRRALVVLGGAALAGLTIAAIATVRARREPAACPYGQRFFLELPRPFLPTERLWQLLSPAAGERVLEVGPGIGYYSLDAARRVEPGGRLDVLDLQQPMLDETMRRAHLRGLGNVVPTRGDAQALPYPDATFDAAFLVATFGEVPDRDVAMRELRRVLKAGGRLVVGETQPDPHMVSLPDLRGRAGAAGLRFEQHVGGRLGYLARFRAV